MLFLRNLSGAQVESVVGVDLIRSLVRQVIIWVCLQVVNRSICVQSDVGGQRGFQLSLIIGKHAEFFCCVVDSICQRRSFWVGYLRYLILSWFRSQHEERM